MHTINFITHLQAARSLARRAERGDDASFEFTTAILPLMLMVCLIAFATVIRSAQLPAWTAASECARAGIATLNYNIGKQQAEDAGYNSLHGNYLSGSGATVEIVTPTRQADWVRGAELKCRVTYNINVSGIILLEGLLPGNVLPMQVDVSSNIEPYKSNWGS